jgi:hypothetical protein
MKKMRILPPKHLWLYLDFSNIKDIKTFETIYDIIYHLPNNKKELRIFRYYYGIFIGAIQQPLPPLTKGIIHKLKK